MFTEPIETARRELVVRFEINDIDVTMRHLDNDSLSLTEEDNTSTSPVKATETILSNKAGEKL